MSLLFNQITIIGVGLMGGSLAKTIRKKRICKNIVGFFRNKVKLNRAIKKKIVDKGYLDLKKSIDESDLIILALPINQIISFLIKIKGIVKNKTLIMDIGSTKFKIVEIANRLKLDFVGAHPLVGSEKKGMDFSSHKLYEDSKVLITPTKKTNKQAINKIKSFWKKLNVEIVTLSPKKHDKILAYTSHLPHLISFGLINSIPKEFLKYGASGLRDTTRIVLSDVEIWSDILLSNRKELLKSLKLFKRQIEKLRTTIYKNKKKQLMRTLNFAKNKRERIK